MKVTTKTLKGWANNSDFLFSENSKNDKFLIEFKELKKNLLKKGFKELNTSFDSLRDKKASQKIIIKAWFWGGSWSNPKKKQYTVFYK